MSRYIRALLCCVVIALIVAGASPIRASDVGSLPLRLALRPDMPPYQFFDMEGRPQGLVVTVWESWTRATGTPVIFVPVTENEIPDAFARSRIDAVAALPAQLLPRFGLAEAAEVGHLSVGIFSHTGTSSPDPADQGQGSVTSPAIPAGMGLATILQDTLPGVNPVVFPDTTSLLAAAHAGNVRQIALYMAHGDYLRKHGRLEGFDAGIAVASSRLVAALPAADIARKQRIRLGFSRLADTDHRDLEAMWHGAQTAFPFMRPLVLLGALTFLLLVVVLGRNLALRRRMEKERAERRRTENMLDGFLERLPDNHFTLDVDGTGAVVMASNGTEDVLGVSPDEAPSRLRHLLPPTKDGAWSQASFSIEVAHADGSLRTLDCLATTPDERGHRRVLVFDTTRRNLERQRVEAIHHRYMSILDNAPVGIFRIMPDGSMVGANREMARLWGFSSPEELLASEEARRLILCDDPKACPLSFARIAASGGLVNEEVLCRTRDGRSFTGLVSARAVPQDDDVQSYVDGFLLDISQLKEARDKLRQTSRNLADIIDFYPDATLVVDAAGRLVAWNRAMEELTGIAAADMIGKGDYEYALPFYGERIPILCDLLRDPAIIPAARYSLLEQTEHRIVVELPLPFFRKGRGLFVWTAASALTDEHGKVTAVIQVIRDVTERRIELEALAKSRERYQMAIEATNEGIWEWDVTTGELYHSPRCVEILGRGGASAPDTLLRDLSLQVHPDDRLRMVTLTQSLMTEPVERFSLECRMRHPVQGWRWVLCHGVVQRNGSGGPRRITGSIADITERKQSEIISAILLQISNAVNVTHDIEGLFSTIHDILRSYVAAENFFIALVDEKQDRLEFPYHTDEKDPSLPRLESISSLASPPPTLEVIRTGRQLLLSYEDLLGRAYIGTIASVWLGTPLRVRGKVIGAMVLQHYSDPDAFSDSDARLMTSLADQIAVAIERKQNEEQLTYLALHDSLTGLPNRTLLLERIEQARLRSLRGKGRSFAVMMIDLDRFKIINDSHGHAVGDRLLQMVSAAVRPVLRPADTVARLGGDEFAILLEDVATPREVVHVARRVIKAVERPARVANKLLRTSASVGIVLRTDGYGSADELLRDADIAMYQAKEQGRGRFRVFNRTMHQQAMDAMNLENDLGAALRWGQFELDYQPVFDTRSRALLGFEALVRWRHPLRGLIPPTAFIPVAEETGIITRLGHWVLETALTALARWRLQIPGIDDLYVAVNMSALQFAQPTLPGSVRDALQKTGLPASCLKVEITETAIMQDPTTALQRISALRDLGVGIGIDDFGTGYSSLAYLQRFPVDTLKVDRSFVSQSTTPEGEGNREIVRAVVVLAHSLSLAVVAEGVETEEQFAFLAGLGCDAVQGYLLSRPVPEADIPAHISTTWALPAQGDALPESP
ncbi:MAG TPA: histidine kinase [Desulfovibrio sp.]|nr:histidine kinase [Desulfovibrio sp.]